MLRRQLALTAAKEASLLLGLEGQLQTDTFNKGYCEATNVQDLSSFHMYLK